MVVVVQLLLLLLQRSGKTLTNKDKGVEILSNKDSQLVSSHLFVAVTDSDHRGSYVCVATNTHGETRKTFLIKGLLTRYMQERNCSCTDE